LKKRQNRVLQKFKSASKNERDGAKMVESMEGAEMEQLQKM
jgi:hypothetical protein